MMQHCGVMAIIPAVLLVTVSYFVLIIRAKTEDSTLKLFGLVLAIVLWVSAAVTLGMGVGMSMHGMGCGAGGHWKKAGMEKMPMHGMRGGACGGDQACPVNSGSMPEPDESTQESSEGHEGPRR